MLAVSLAARGSSDTHAQRALLPGAAVVDGGLAREEACHERDRVEPGRPANPWPAGSAG